MATSSPRLTTFGSFATGATAACTAVLATNPMEVVKTRLQLDGEGVRGQRQYRGIVHALTTIASKEGIQGVQAGLIPALMYQTLMNGARLGLYEPVQRSLVSLTGADPTSITLKAASGALSGAVGATLGSPVYLVKNRLQAASKHFVVRESHQYSGMLDAFSKIWKEGGVRGIFRGLDGALPRVMFGSATQLSSYDTCKSLVASAGVPDGVPQHLAASLAASLLTVTVMNPLDVVSTRLYQSAGHATKYSGPIDCAIKTVSLEGIGALQKGWLAQYTRLGPHTILTFLLLEQIRPIFIHWNLFTQ